MANSRKRGLLDKELEKYLNLDESDIEISNFDDDMDDADFQPQSCLPAFIESSSSSSEDEHDVLSPETLAAIATSEEPQTSRPIRGTSRTRTCSRSRGRGRGRGRGRSSRGRGRTQSMPEGSTTASSSSYQENEEFDQHIPANEWTEEPFIPELIPFTEPAYLPINNDFSFKKYDYLRQYITDNLMETIVNKSNEMYFVRNGRLLNSTLSEWNTYVAITLAMSCIGYPQLRMYWDNSFRVPLIADHMSRNRFFMLRNALKVVNDNDISDEDKKNDKLWKVRPLLEVILQGCQTVPRTRKLSIDEMMIPFTGSCGMKQYCPGKPNPVGLKAFVLATPEGLVCDFRIYQGSNTYPSYADSVFGLGEKTVLSLTETLIPGHIIYCDRYFTSEKLILELQKKQLMCAGTVMKNRVPKTAKPILIEDKDLKKAVRGKWQVLVNKEKDYAITKWLDNKPVSFMSNIHAAQTSDTCQRWCKQKKMYVTVPRPEIVKEYNDNMGGVDLADRMLAVCPNRYRTKKWTIRFISHMIDMAVVNSWLQYKNDQLRINVPKKKIQQLRSFKIEVAKIILESSVIQDLDLSQSFENEEPPPKRSKAAVQIPSQTFRTHGALHLPSAGEQQNRCRRPECNKKSTIICTMCQVALCLTKDRNCFYQFHTKN